MVPDSEDIEIEKEYSNLEDIIEEFEVYDILDSIKQDGKIFYLVK